MAAIAVYLGEVDENKINNMSFPFFNEVLSSLGKKVNYDAVVNYAGNAFAKDSWQIIQDANPLTKKVGNMSRGFNELINKTVAVASKKDMDDMSWAT